MRFLAVLCLMLVTATVWGQINDIRGKQKDSCYFRYKTVTENGETKQIRIDQVKELQRYVEWECGKEIGVVDCNRELKYEEETNTVFREAKDFTNIASLNKPFTGTCQSCHMNGRVQRRVNFVNGKEEGLDTTYYESGCPEVIRNHIEGIDHGTWYYMYDSTGLLAWEMNFYVGEKHGKQIYFKLNRENPGRIGLDTVKWENYDMGVLDGWRRVYHNNGVLKREVFYDHGVYNGAFRIFNEERVVVEELNFKNGKKHKECNFYYEDGVLLRSENWDNGLKHGDFKMYYYDQVVQTTESYKKGLKHGWFEEFYPDESPKIRSQYEKDELVKQYKYNEHGELIYAFGDAEAYGLEDDSIGTPEDGKKKKKKKKKKGAE